MEFRSWLRRARRLTPFQPAPMISKNRMRFLTIIALLALALCARVVAAPALVNGIAVIVDGAVITFEDVEKQVALALPALQSKYGRRPEVLDQKINELRREILQDLMDRQLILHEFKTAGYSFPESMIDDRIKEIIRDRFGDRLTLTKTLQAQGLTYESYRQQVREQFIIDQMRYKNVSSEIFISPYKIEKYYADHREEFKLGDQVKLRMIFLDKSKHSDTRKLAEEILAKLKDGAAFGEMATVYSDGAQKRDGGDYGWVDRSFLREDLAKVAFSLKPGERSDVLETPEDCHLMLVEDSRATHIRPLPEVRDEIEKNLKGQEQERLRKSWIERLKTKSFIQSFIQY